MAFDILTEHGGTGLKDFLSSLVKPLQTNTDSLDDFETEYKKRAKFNGQKIVLQAALNNIFGVLSAPFIIIETNPDIGFNTYFYESSELSPLYFYESSETDPVYFFESSELNTEDFDFKVLIPSGIHTAELERRVRAETNLYKLAGTRFIIETY
jgi:hypothetical protein